MQVGHKLQFNCQNCKKPIFFSVLDSENFDNIVVCPQCRKKYAFGTGTITRDLKEFELLCRQIHASKDILGNTSIAIDVGNHHVKIPYKLLLTRFTSVMELKIGTDKINIAFRVEPLKDIPDSKIIPPHQTIFVSNRKSFAVT